VTSDPTDVARDPTSATAEAAVLQMDRDPRGVVTLTFDRPEVRNAFDAELMGSLTDRVQRLGADDTVRALVLTGAGRVFSAGADLGWMGAMAGYSFEENVTDSHGFEAMLRAVHDAAVPVIARVNGHALGGAAGLLGCVDIAVSVRSARFGFTEARLGLAPAMISAYVQPRIGLAAARRYFLTGERFDASRAYEIGLVHEVCDDDALDATVARVLDELLLGGPAAQRAIKPLIQAVAATSDADATEQLRVELISRLRISQEGQEGLAAFFDHRRPNWAPEPG
jgi:methylglutaconyl-CoA hydratase